MQWQFGINECPGVNKVWPQARAFFFCEARFFFCVSQTRPLHGPRQVSHFVCMSRVVWAHVTSQPRWPSHELARASEYLDLINLWPRGGKCCKTNIKVSFMKAERFIEFTCLFQGLGFSKYFTRFSAVMFSRNR